MTSRSLRAGSLEVLSSGPESSCKKQDIDTDSMDKYGLPLSTSQSPHSTGKSNVLLAKSIQTEGKNVCKELRTY